MARLAELMEFRQEAWAADLHDPELIAYRRVREKLVELEQIVKMPTDYGISICICIGRFWTDSIILPWSTGRIDKKKPTLVRVHSECLTGDVFGSRRCDCGNQLHAALRQSRRKAMAFSSIMRQEGRGIGLAAKIHAYKLQGGRIGHSGANAKLGYPSDLRDYGLGAQIFSISCAPVPVPNE